MVKNVYVARNGVEISGKMREQGNDNTEKKEKFARSYAHEIDKCMYVVIKFQASVYKRSHCHFG